MSVKDLEIEEEKEAMKEYGSSSSGASIGDIIGAALEEDKNKDSEKTKDEKNDSLVKYFLERKSLIKKSFILIIISFFLIVAINNNYKEGPFIAKLYLDGIITSESDLEKKISRLKQKKISKPY